MKFFYEKKRFFQLLKQINQFHKIRFDDDTHTLLYYLHTGVQESISTNNAILDQMKHVMRQMYELHEFTTPRYFFILPAKQHDWAAINTVQNLFRVHYKLYFLCEYSDEPKKLHFAPHDGYSIKKPREFIARYGPYLRNNARRRSSVTHTRRFCHPTVGKCANGCW